MNHSGFSPKARWDRQVPLENDTYDPHNLNQRIEVLAWFKNARIYPRRFYLKNKAYKIKKITYNWQERHGQETISYFSVSTGTDLYQISFNNTSLAWRLDKVIE
ncbi:MAG: hypothetical protein KA022_02260 [Candidatus Omnitrophica bacterium]|nr:hypothetical protein [Candidatus Omnitrophota bacterium]